jgi:hypothetical protein
MKRLAGVTAGATAFLAATVFVVVQSETATVTIHVPMHRAAAYATLTGSRGAGDLPTRHITAQVTEKLTGDASPVTLSTYATGFVVFSFYNGCTYDCRGEVMLPAGFDVATAAGVHYKTQAQAFFPFLSSSRPTPVIAVNSGPSGNAAAGVVTEINNPGPLTVTNPQPITGGTSRNTHVVLQKDYDAVRAQLTVTATSDAQASMLGKIGGLRYVADGKPAVTVTSDHAVGDEIATFTLTATISLSANGFSDARARQLLRSALSAQFLAGEAVAPDSVSTDYSILQMTPDGQVVVIGTASGSATRSVATEPLRLLIASSSPDQARKTLESAVPGARVDIRVGPFGLPWLPADPNRIRMIVAAQ